MGNLLSTNPSTTQVVPTSTQNQVTISTTSPNINTIPPATTKELMNQQLAKNISNLQNTIINTAQANANAVSNITLNALAVPTVPTASNIEGFTIQQPLDVYQKPLYIPPNSAPELDDYISAYNKSVALLDDPNRLSQANFDAYIHLQDNKIKQLQSAISSFPTNSTQQNNPFRSIKNLKTSQSLNLEPYPDPATQTNLPNYYVGNGASTYPNYLIYTNNGCLQYTPGDSTNKSSATWEVRHCNSNLPEQRFNMQQVNNMDQYNAFITDSNNASYKITDPNSSIFGFYIVNPEGNGDQCLQFNGDGLSVMPCNMDSSQRFKPYYHSIKP
jgi:hypothetical protein